MGPRPKLSVVRCEGVSVLEKWGRSERLWMAIGSAQLRPHTGNSPIRGYAWGLDLSGEVDGAAGIGGLIGITDHSSWPPGRHFTMFDGNGNIVGLVKADGNVSARYEYGPFGEPIRVTGTFARTNPFRWSTKYWDEETDLVYYGYRYYSPNLGRWISRDPVEEQGGLNLYPLCQNCPLVAIDPLGRFAFGDVVSSTAFRSWLYSTAAGAFAGRVTGGWRGMIAGALGGAVAGLPGNMALTGFGGGVAASAVGNYLNGNREMRPGASLLGAGLSGIAGMVGGSLGNTVVSKFADVATATVDIELGNVLAFGGLGLLSGYLGAAADSLTLGLAELMELWGLDSQVLNGESMNTVEGSQ